MYKKILIMATCFLAGAVSLEAQQDPQVTSDENDTKFQSTFRPQSTIQYYDVQNKVLEWETVRVIDVMWKKTVWREIDLRERMNTVFKYNNIDYGDGMYIEILLNAVKSGQVQAFNSVDDRFSIKLSAEDIDALTAGKMDTFIIEDPITGEFIQEINKIEFNPNKVIKYRIKEETYFDKVRGKMYTRILGIAPVREVESSTGEKIGDEAMFWIYYPDLRQVNADHMVFNPLNDISTITWDDIFEKRMFASNLIRMSSEHQSTIRGYKGDGLEAFYESERLKQQLFNREQDLWVY